MTDVAKKLKNTEQDAEAKLSPTREIAITTTTDTTIEDIVVDDGFLVGI